MCPISVALFIILVSLTMTIFSEKVLISYRCISGLMSNLIKKSWTDSNMYVVVGAPAALGKSDAAFQCNNDKDYHVALHTYYIQFLNVYTSYNILHFCSF